MKSDSFDDHCETDSAASDKISPGQGESKDTLTSFDSNYNTIKPKMKKPPRKSRDEKALSKSETSCQTMEDKEMHCRDYRVPQKGGKLSG